MPSAHAVRPLYAKRAAASDGVTKALEGELLGAARQDADAARGRLASSRSPRASSSDGPPSRRDAGAVAWRGAGASGGLARGGELSRAPTGAVLNLQGVPTLQFTAPVPAASLPVSMQSLTALIDRIDSAAALASAIRTSREADARHYRLSLERRAPAAMPAVYAALRPISHWGATFDAGDLIDSSLINTSTLYRLQVARCIAAADRAAAA